MLTEDGFDWVLIKKSIFQKFRTIVFLFLWCKIDKREVILIIITIKNILSFNDITIYLICKCSNIAPVVNVTAPHPRIKFGPAMIYTVY